MIERCMGRSGRRIVKELTRLDVEQRRQLECHGAGRRQLANFRVKLRSFLRMVRVRIVSQNLNRFVGQRFKGLSRRDQTSKLEMKRRKQTAGLGVLRIEREQFLERS